jgi:hypothetical protein
MALAPRLALGARSARPIRLSCRIAELGEFVHDPCSDAKQKGAQGPFLFGIGGAEHPLSQAA